MEIKIKCIHCRQSHYIKKGFRKTENRGKIQLYRCLACSRKFSNDEGFYRMRNSEAKITQAIDLYYSHLSSRKIRNHFRRHLDHNASHETILAWARRYVLKVQKYVDTLKPQLSGKIYADETEIDCEDRNDIFWCAIDWDTRFINATLYSPKAQNVDDAITFMRRIKLYKRPKYIQTDAGMFYPRAFHKVFWTQHTQEEPIEHIIINKQKTGRYNVRIETVFSKIKDRVDDFRGLKALWSAPILMAGIVLQHNFIEEHTTTRVRPCELAGIKVGEEPNKWLELIKLASA